MAKTKAEQLEYKRRWYSEHRDRERAKRREYRLAHKDRLNAQLREKYRADPEAANARHKEARAADPERMRGYTRAYYASFRGRALALLRGARQRAARKGLAYDLTADWLVEKLAAGVCEATGRKFDIAERGVGPWAPSLDQRVAGAGYTRENTQVVVWAYNFAKGPWTDAEFNELASLIVRRIAAGGFAG